MSATDLAHDNDGDDDDGIQMQVGIGYFASIFVLN